MTPHYADDAVTLYHGDCLDVLRELPDASVDAVVTDPPYGLEFMGKEWDSFGRGGAVSRATAGIMSGGISAAHGRPSFLGGLNPKCTSCGKSQRGGSPCHCESPTFTDERGPRLAAFQAWCEQWAAECLRVLKPGGHLLAFGGTRTWHRLACAIEDAGFEVRDSIAWLYGSGFPKSLDVSKAIDKAAGAVRGVEASSDVAPFRSGTTHCSTCGRSRGSQPGNCQCDTRGEPQTDDAHTWSGWGTALKPAHEPIVVARKPLDGTVAANVLRHGTGALNIDGCRIGFASEADERESKDKNRWPANVVLDESQAAELDAMTDGASRFLYVAKAPTAERPRDGEVAHPTVKPLDLMRWLVRLVTPPGGTVLEPFAGSGTTAEACVIEGFQCIAIEREADYLPLIVQRLTKPIQPDLFGGVA